MDDKTREAIARRLCEIRGLDPDRVPTGHIAPEWSRAFAEVYDFLDVLQAIRDVEGV